MLLLATETQESQAKQNHVFLLGCKTPSWCGSPLDVIRDAGSVPAGVWCTPRMLSGGLGSGCVETMFTVPQTGSEERGRLEVVHLTPHVAPVGAWLPLTAEEAGKWSACWNGHGVVWGACATEGEGKSGNRELTSSRCPGPHIVLWWLHVRTVGHPREELSSSESQPVARA